MNILKNRINTKSTKPGHVTIDYSAVKANDVQKQIVEDTIKYLGKKDYEELKKTISEHYSLDKNFTPFNTFSFFLSMKGISGELVCLMLAIEWELQNYITNFDTVFDSWLDRINERSKN